MALIMRAEQPEMYIRITAQTAKKTWVQTISAGAHHASDATAQVESDSDMGSTILAPSIPGPQVITIPGSFGSVVTGYDQTSPNIKGTQERVTKTNQALRKAESWGWSKSLSNIKRIEFATQFTNVYLFVANRAPGSQVAIAPPEVLTGEPGLVVIDTSIVDSYDESSLNEHWLFPRLLIHESLHHALYTVGYSLRLKFPGFLAALYDFFSPTLTQHHWGTTLASTVNACTLGLQMLNDIGTWQVPGIDVILPHNITGDPHVSPDLRAKSVVDTTQDPHQTFGTRLDNIESILGLQGVGGWIDQFCPPLNYTTSGESPAADQLVMNLSNADGSLAWQIAGQAMVRTVDKWAEYGKLNNNANIKSTAVSMGMVALMAKLGMIPKK